MSARRLDTAVSGPARVDRRTKDLVKRLRPGDIAVIDHRDLDRVAAEGLIEAGVAAVINAEASISGRYPNLGPLLVAAAGIPLLDEVGPEVMERVTEGAPVHVDGEVVRCGDWEGRGTRQDIQSLEARIEKAKEVMGEELERFAANTLDYLRRERHLILDGVDMPQVRTNMRGRHVLIVVRGTDYREDLQALRRGGYLHDMRPVLIGVDGGADALVELGHQPDIVIGDFDSVSEETLRSGAELVVHAYPGGRAPGAERLDALGLPYVIFEAPGTSEDIAMLLAYEQGAELICAVGTHSSMVEFLDKGRAGMASTVLVRMKVGPVLVDAKGVSRLYRGQVRKRDMLLLVVAALFAMIMVTAVSPPARLFLRNLWTGLLFG